MAAGSTTFNAIRWPRLESRLTKFYMPDLVFSTPDVIRPALGFRLNHSQNATRVAKATAERKFLASLS